MGGAEARPARPAALRVLEELRALDARSGGARVAWTPGWQREREWLTHELSALPGVSVERDEAGNLWARLAGLVAETVIVGSHLDSVPDGGWLDGALGVLAGLELMRELAGGPLPQRSIALVDWADEEGARFGYSLFGSSAAAGLLSVDVLSELRDADGNSLRETLRGYDIDLDRAPLAAKRLLEAAAYLELHIEQGPELVTQGRSCAAVCGALGIRRSRVRVSGDSVHAGAPLEMRHDPSIVGSALVLAAREAAQRSGGRATVGSFELRPGIVTVVAAECELTVDLRHADAGALEQLECDVLATAERLAAEEGCAITVQRLLDSGPVAFTPDLVSRFVAASDGGDALLSWAQHDAVAIARSGVPTAMLFVRSRGGVSHSREENSSDEDLLRAVDAFREVVTGLLTEPALDGRPTDLR